MIGIMISSRVAGVKEFEERGVRVMSDGQGWEKAWFEG